MDYDPYANIANEEFNYRRTQTLNPESKKSKVEGKWKIFAFFIMNSTGPTNGLPAACIFTAPIFFVENFFGRKFFSSKKPLLVEKFSRRKTFSSKIFFVEKIIPADEYNERVLKFWPHFFSSKIFFVEKLFRRKLFSSKKNFDEKVFRPKKFSAKTIGA